MNLYEIYGRPKRTKYNPYVLGFIEARDSGSALSKAKRKAKRDIPTYTITRVRRVYGKPVI